MQLDSRKKMLTWTSTRNVSGQECTIDTPTAYSATVDPQVSVRGSRLVALRLVIPEFSCETTLAPLACLDSHPCCFCPGRKKHFLYPLRLLCRDVQIKMTRARFFGRKDVQICSYGNFLHPGRFRGKKGNPKQQGGLVPVF